MEISRHPATARLIVIALTTAASCAALAGCANPTNPASSPGAGAAVVAASSNAPVMPSAVAPTVAARTVAAPTVAAPTPSTRPLTVVPAADAVTATPTIASAPSAVPTATVAPAAVAVTATPTSAPAPAAGAPAGPDPAAAPHFDSPDAAMRYLVAAYNAHDVTAEMHVTTPASRAQLESERQWVNTFSFDSCIANPGAGDYSCRFDMVSKVATETTGVDAFGSDVTTMGEITVLVAPAARPGWYMYYNEGCGGG